MIDRAIDYTVLIQRPGPNQRVSCNIIEDIEKIQWRGTIKAIGTRYTLCPDTLCGHHSGSRVAGMGSPTPRSTYCHSVIESVEISIQLQDEY